MRKHKFVVEIDTNEDLETSGGVIFNRLLKVKGFKEIRVKSVEREGENWENEK